MTMGAVKKYLAQRTLKDRERHNSRLFVDLCENIHIHFREYRLIFSLDEYFEFVDIVSKSTRDVRNYLYKNPEYQEEKFPTTIMVACGPHRQLKFLQNSPKPNQSEYHNNHFAIELQEETITDEIHVHWRDLRVALSRENFKDVAEGFIEAHKTLADFETQHDYQRKAHFDRAVDGLNNAELDGEQVQGVEKLPLDKIVSYWCKDLKTLKSDWKRNNVYIDVLKSRFVNREPVPPLLVSRANQDGVHYIVNGHHRYLAAREADLDAVDAIVMPMSFEETEDLRKAELLLKSFDQKTGYQYGLTPFLNDFVAYKLNRFYANDFQQRVGETARPTASKVAGKWRRFAKRIEDTVRGFGKRATRPQPQSTDAPVKKSKAA
jgi:ParB-like nuclease domain